MPDALAIWRGTILAIRPYRIADSPQRLQGLGSVEKIPRQMEDPAPTAHWLNRQMSAYVMNNNVM